MGYTAHRMLTHRVIRDHALSSEPPYLKPLHPAARQIPDAAHPTFLYATSLDQDPRVMTLSRITAITDPAGGYTGDWHADLWTYPRHDTGRDLVEAILLLEPPHATVHLGERLDHVTAWRIEWHAWLHHSCQLDHQ